MTLCIKQYGEYRLSALNGRPEFLQKIHTFVTLRSKRCEESQLSLVNNTGSINSAKNNSEESIKNCEYFPEFVAKFEKPSDTE